MNSNVHTFQELVDEPDKRFQEFFRYNTDVEINPSFTIDRYVRSGKELIRMANIYFKEKDYFQSFVLYSRFSLLYGQLLKSHPGYSKFNKADLVEINKEIKSIALPRAENLKVYIKEIFEKEAKEHQDQIVNENRAETNKKIQPEQSSPEDRQPEIDQFKKPKNLNFRPINIPGDTMIRFLEIANANTLQNIETCGILAGRLAQNTFILTHCILPKQKGTSDTCSTEYENELCEVIDTNNLITLGWIHTHPSQTAFLSSIDLHTHFGYQLMIPEAIAIVCAPSYNQNGIFILNQSGLKEISECNKSGFHPHTKTPQLFEECDHVNMDNKSRIQIVDLRMISNKSY